MRLLTAAGLFFSLLGLVGCFSSGQDDPREVVLTMIRGMDRSDGPAIASCLDFASLLTPGATDYALRMDSVRAFPDSEALLKDLTAGGLTRERWLEMQRVVGSTTMSGDTALVEVSFISRLTNTQNYNKWGLRKINGQWKIFSFHMLKE